MQGSVSVPLLEWPKVWCSWFKTGLKSRVWGIYAGMSECVSLIKVEDCPAHAGVMLTEREGKES